MRILLLTQWYLPEPARLLSELAEGLQAAGHKVTVLTGFPNYPSGKVYPGYRIRPWQRETLDGVDVIRVPLYPSHSPSAVGRVFNYLSFALSAALLGVWLLPRIDVIHVYSPPPTTGLAGWFLGCVRRVPFTLEVQDVWPESLEATGMVSSKWVLRTAGGFVRWVYRRAAAIRVISPGFRDNLIAKGVPPAKIHVVSNWVDANLYQPADKNAALADQLGMAGRFTVMIAGTIGFAQGVDTVLDAAGLTQDLSDVQFVFVGDGADSARVQAAAKSRNLTNVKFLGQQPAEAIPGLYALADVLLLHLRDEPLFRITIPHRVFAYMASAKPILAAIGGNTADVVSEANAGLICLPGNPSAMADAIRRFYAMPPRERQAMGENGRRAVLDKYRHDRLIGQVMTILESV